MVTLGCIEEGESQDLRAVQARIHEWAERTFPGRKPEHSISKLVLEEIPEMLAHKKRFGRVGIEGEMADCFILLLDICSLWGIDASQAIMEKMEINSRRTWVKDEATGFYNHVFGSHLKQELFGPVESEGGEP